MALLKIVFICQAVDPEDRSVPHLVRWVNALAACEEVAAVNVLTLRVRPCALHSRVQVTGIGGAGRMFTIGRLYRAVIGLVWRRQVTHFFVCQGGAYPLLLWPFKLFLRIPICQWKAHTEVGQGMRFYARFIDSLLFTPSPSSFPLPLANVRVVGHGVDTDQFVPSQQAVSADLVAIGRIAPVKRLENVIALLRLARERGRLLRVDFIGPTSVADRAYRLKLEELAVQAGVREQINFCDDLPHAELPRLLPRYRAMLFLCRGALGKVVLEAFACGIPVVSDNVCVAEVLPANLRDQLVVPFGDVAGLLTKVLAVLDMGASERCKLGEELRAIVQRDHDVTSLFHKICHEMQRAA